jgi:hypothetical protein
LGGRPLAGGATSSGRRGRDHALIGRARVRRTTARLASAGDHTGQATTRPDRTWALGDITCAQADITRARVDRARPQFDMTRAQADITGVLAVSASRLLLSGGVLAASVRHYSELARVLDASTSAKSQQGDDLALRACVHAPSARGIAMPATGKAWMSTARRPSARDQRDITTMLGPSSRSLAVIPRPLRHGLGPNGRPSSFVSAWRS